MKLHFMKYLPINMMGHHKLLSIEQKLKISIYW